MTTKHNRNVKVGDRVKLETGETGTVVSIQESKNESFPYVYEVKTKTLIHVTNNVTPLKQSLAKLISITLNQ